MELIGSRWSPFVRRVRVVCAERGVPFTLTDSSLPDGERRLRETSPLWKVPVAVFATDGDGQPVWDSRAILDEVGRRYGAGAFARTADLRQSNILSAIDGALDSAINVFYLSREGVAVDGIPYCQKQRGRVRAALNWVGERLAGAQFGATDFGIAELSLYTALDWMIFRNAVPVADFPRLMAFRAAHAERPSLLATAPNL